MPISRYLDRPVSRLTRASDRGSHRIASGSCLGQSLREHQLTSCLRSASAVWRWYWKPRPFFDSSAPRAFRSLARLGASAAAYKRVTPGVKPSLSSVRRPLEQRCDIGLQLLDLHRNNALFPDPWSGARLASWVVPPELLEVTGNGRASTGLERKSTEPWTGFSELFGNSLPPALLSARVLEVTGHRRALPSLAGSLLLGTIVDRSFAVTGIKMLF